jgi:hypothetical protein
MKKAFIVVYKDNSSSKDQYTKLIIARNINDAIHKFNNGIGKNNYCLVDFGSLDEFDLNIFGGEDGNT